MDAAKQKSDLRSKLSAIFLSGLHKTMGDVGKDEIDEGTAYNQGYGPSRDASISKKKTIMERA